MLCNLNYDQCLNIAPMEKALFRPQWSILSLFIAPMEKALSCERFLFEVVLIVVKGKNKT